MTASAERRCGKLSRRATLNDINNFFNNINSILSPRIVCSCKLCDQILVDIFIDFLV
jgi:hypothetical protein